MYINLTCYARIWLYSTTVMFANKNQLIHRTGKVVSAPVRYRYHPKRTTCCINTWLLHINSSWKIYFWRKKFFYFVKVLPSRSRHFWSAPEPIFWTVGASKNEKLSFCNKHEISSEFIKPNMIQKRFLLINRFFRDQNWQILLSRVASVVEPEPAETDFLAGAGAGENTPAPGHHL